MTAQPEATLFDLPLPEPGLNAFGLAHKAPRDTEREAARLIAPVSGSQRQRVLAAIREAGEHGITDEELSGALELSLNSVRPRRVELITAGWVQDSGNRRLTASGRECTVWTLTDQARAS